MVRSILQNCSIHRFIPIPGRRRRWLASHPTIYFATFLQIGELAVPHGTESVLGWLFMDLDDRRAELVMPFHRSSHRTFLSLNPGRVIHSPVPIQLSLYELPTLITSLTCNLSFEFNPSSHRSLIPSLPLSHRLSSSTCTR